MDHLFVEAIGYGGTALTVASYSMRTIIPLRVAGILSSVLFIIYAVIIQSWPVLAMEMVLLPLNTVRLFQVLRMVRRIDEAAATSELSSTWLKPFSRRLLCKAGDTIFKEGDAADYLLIIESGQFRLAESQIVLGPGELVGEMGFLSPGNKRTATLVCTETGEVGRVSYHAIRQLYFANPKFAFYFA